MEIIRLTKKNVDEVVQKFCEVISSDGIVVFPSDTVYGLAVNVLSKEAVSRLLVFKDRPKGKAISIAVPSIEILRNYATIHDKQRQLVEALLPGPFTLVLSSLHKTDLRLEAEDGTLGIRIPNNNFIQKVTASLPFPITATSANVNGKGPHYSIDAFLNTLSQKKRDQLSLVVDAGTLPNNAPSTVLRMGKDTLKILRPGAFMLKNKETFQSESTEQTMDIAQKLIKKYQHSAEKKPLLFILKGDLGTGKTVFAKGAGACIGVTETVVSPTYVVCFEYATNHPLYKKFHHFDLYNVETKEELLALNIAQLLTPHTIILVEWGERLGNLMPLVTQSSVKTILVIFTDEGENKRQLDIYEVN